MPGLSVCHPSTNILIIKVALPVVGALALEPVMSLIDTYYVGKYLGESVSEPHTPRGSYGGASPNQLSVL